MKMIPSTTWPTFETTAFTSASAGSQPICLTTVSTIRSSPLHPSHVERSVPNVRMFPPSLLVQSRRARRTDKACDAVFQLADAGLVIGHVDRVLLALPVRIEQRTDEREQGRDQHP